MHNGTVLVSKEETDLCLLAWIRALQKEVYQHIYSSLLQDPTGASLQKRDRKKGLFLDANDIIRMKTRLVHSPCLPEDSIFPIILPGKDALSQLLLRDIHTNNAHCPAVQVLHLVQRAYWLQDGKRAIHKALSKCYRCQQVYGKGLALPAPGPMPADQARRWASLFTVRWH